MVEGVKHGKKGSRVEEEPITDKYFFLSKENGLIPNKQYTKKECPYIKIKRKLSGVSYIKISN
jgi:hypothetical protein